MIIDKQWGALSVMCQKHKLQNVNYIKIAFSQSVLKIETSGSKQKATKFMHISW